MYINDVQPSDEGAEPRAEQHIFNDLAKLCVTPGFVHVLAWIALKIHYRIVDPDTGTTVQWQDSCKFERIIRTEFFMLLGLLIREPINLSEPTDAEFSKLRDSTYQLLQELHKRLDYSRSKRTTKLQNDGRKAEQTVYPPPFSAEELREPIFYGGDSAYEFQYRDMACKRYKKDEAWLLTNKRFRIADAVDTVNAILEIQKKKVSDVGGQAKAEASSPSSLLPLFTITAEEIKAYCDQPVERVQAVLSAFSTSAPCNRDFTSLGMFNLANACPIIALSDRQYIAFSIYGIFESLYDSPFYWMVGDKAYCNQASKHRGAFTERFVAERLRLVFGEQNVFCNVTIKDASKRVSDIDVLVLFGDRAVIVQCKSKKMTLESRHGHDQMLQDDFKKAVQNAYDQGLCCAESLIQEPGLDVVKEDKSKLKIPKLRHIYIMCVVSDPYPGLMLQAQQFLNYQEDAVIHPPLVADVFFIDVLTEMLERPLFLLSYIDRRVGYFKRVVSTNELAILGSHLQWNLRNLWLDDKVATYWIDESAVLYVYEAMAARRLVPPGTKTPKGILTRYTGTYFDQIIKKIEHEAAPDWIDLGFFFLTLGSEAVTQLNKTIEKVMRRTRKDGKQNDFTLPFGEGKPGLTIHCNPAHDAFEMLTKHCDLWKYRCRADSWFGLLVSETDGLPERICVIRSPWKQDMSMDQRLMWLKDNHGAAQSASQNRAPDGTKIGRNDLCLCGSGKKFKKCCLV